MLTCKFLCFSCLVHYYVICSGYFELWSSVLFPLLSFLFYRQHTAFIYWLHCIAICSSSCLEDLYIRSVDNQKRGYRGAIISIDILSTIRTCGWVRWPEIILCYFSKFPGSSFVYNPRHNDFCLFFFWHECQIIVFHILGHEGSCLLINSGHKGSYHFHKSRALAFF